jgi:hypothetical protein
MRSTVLAWEQQKVGEKMTKEHLRTNMYISSSYKTFA